MWYPFQQVRSPSTGELGGFFPADPVELVCKLRGSSSIAGDVLQQDYLGLQVTADSETVEATPGTNGSVWFNTSAPTANGVLATAAGAAAAGPFFLICQKTVADLGTYSGICYGITNAFLIASSGNVNIGTGMGVTTAKNLASIAGAAARKVGFGMVGLVTPTSRTLGLAYLNGVGHIGSAIEA